MGLDEINNGYIEILFIVVFHLILGIFYFFPPKGVPNEPAKKERNNKGKQGNLKCQNDEKHPTKTNKVCLSKELLGLNNPQGYFLLHYYYFLLVLLLKYFAT